MPNESQQWWQKSKCQLLEQILRNMNILCAEIRISGFYELLYQVVLWL